VRERLLRSEVDRVTLLDTYSRIRSGKRVADEASSGVVTALRLSGVVKQAATAEQVAAWEKECNCSTTPE